MLMAAMERNVTSDNRGCEQTNDGLKCPARAQDPLPTRAPDTNLTEHYY